MLGFAPLVYLALGAPAVFAQAGPGAATPPGPAAPAPAPEAPDQATLDARRHFKSGTKLYRDGNYGGALAEFEEAYRLKPGAGSLQNVALSQKGLFRYAEAAASLEQLLARHASELSEAERKAVDDALAELRALIASVRLRVEPAHARVLLDGRSLSAADLAAPIVLNVGEHALSVDAPGYAPERRVLRVAGGQRELPVEVVLRCTAGFVDVTSNDPTANIAIDGLPKARRAYRGPVEPDAEHLVQVYREGVETFEQTFRVGLCKTVSIAATLEGVETAAPAQVSPDAPLESAPTRRNRRGFYALASLDLLGLSEQPLNLDLSKAQGGGGVGALGLRGGYRLSSPVAIDLMLDVGALNVTGAFDKTTMTTRDYSMRSVHFGPDLKLMTTGESLRFVTTVGAGLVHHRLAVGAGGGASSAEVNGLDPYFLLELSFGFNYRHFLGELGLIALIDGTTALQKGFPSNAPNDPNAGLTSDLGTALTMVGIGLRGGFSQWSPGR